MNFSNYFVYVNYFRIDFNVFVKRQSFYVDLFLSYAMLLFCYNLNLLKIAFLLVMFLMIAFSNASLLLCLKLKSS